MDSLIADFRVARKRLKESPPTTVEGMIEELRNNVYPSMIALAEQVAEVDEVVLEMSEQQDSYIQSELAAQIFSTIAIGGQVLEEVRNLMPEMSDLTAKRLKDLLDGFEHSMELTVMGVSEATIEDDGEDGDDGEEEEDDAESEEEATEPGKIIAPDETPVTPGPEAEAKEESTNV
jgi:hypothetical protein